MGTSRHTARACLRVPRDRPMRASQRKQPKALGCLPRPWAAYRGQKPTEGRNIDNETDDNQIQLVGGDVELPKELAKMIEQDNEEEEEKNSVIGQLSNIQNLDLDSLKDKASATLEDLKQSAEKCAVM
nr:PREDICTED: complexin-3 [Struthio camelus australis]